MSGPRRHGSRRTAAACLFALLVLAMMLVRSSGASATSGVSAHSRGHHSAGLLGSVGKLVTGLGHNVDHVLTGVGALLGNQPHARPPAPTPPASTPAPPPTRSRPAPQSSPPLATTAPARHRVEPQARQVAAAVVPRHASPVATSSSVRQSSTPIRTRSAVRAVDSAPADIPGLDLTAALAAVMIATVLGVGLIVHRAGYRGARSH